jgi:hypothetical protein
MREADLRSLHDDKVTSPKTIPKYLRNASGLVYFVVDRSGRISNFIVGDLAKFQTLVGS